MEKLVPVEGKGRDGNIPKKVLPPDWWNEKRKEKKKKNKNKIIKPLSPQS